jgi:hypothetical protein
MNTRRHTKLLHEGDYAAEIEIELTDADGEWGPYLSLEDAVKLDAVREALRSGDLHKAQSLGRIFRLIPIDRLDQSGKVTISR